jgi:hypothetical protein
VRGRCRFGERAVAAMVSRGILGGRQAEGTHQLAGFVATCEGPPGGPEGDRAGALDATQGLERVDDGTEAPALPPIGEFLCEPSQTCALFRHGSDGVWEHDVLRGCGTDALTAPAPGGRGPQSPGL